MNSKNSPSKIKGLAVTYYDKIVSSMTPMGLTPNIIEERQMNVAVFDVFSRLMMDRIIFMGTAINDQVANIIQAQLIVFRKYRRHQRHPNIHQLTRRKRVCRTWNL